MRDLAATLTRLARPVVRLRGNGERGAVGILVAILIGGGVLIGMGALVVDVGQIYQNRAELQNGSDAGALAVAKSCALALSSCSPAGSVIAASVEATGNASSLTGHQAGVQFVCGSGVLGGCTTNIGNATSITNCPSNPALGTNYVDVRTETKAAGGSLPGVFARTLLGNQNYNGTTVFACSQAEWGPAEQSNSLALTLSYCDWQVITSNKFNTLIPVYLKGSSEEKPCGGPAGQNIPGGFGWLQPTSSGVCTAAIDLTTNTTDSNPGNSASGPCKAALVSYVADYNAGHPATVFLPIYGSAQGSGNNATYTIMGFAGFVITGYADISGAGNAGPKSDGPTNTLCTAGKNNPCIEGYFLPGIDPAGTSLGIGGTNFGAVTIKLSG